MQQPQVAPEAREAIDRARARWRKHNLAAPNLFDDELAESLAKIGANPLHYRSVKGRGLKNARVFVMKRTSFLLFFKVDDDDPNLVLVLKLRHGVRRPIAK
jgi:hypothetical protein